MLQRVLPARGRVLEVASGTGQHVVHFARAMPGLTWLPSDPEAAHREAIQASLGAVLGSVNVKATTGEGMGFVGRGEGAAALAVATLG